jgi:TolA-binding protein
MYKLEDVYKTFPSGATEEYKILRAFEMGKQEGGAKVKELEAQIADLEKENAELKKEWQEQVQNLNELEF